MLKTKIALIAVVLVLLGMKDAAGSWKENPVVRFVLQEMRFDTYEQAVRSTVLNLLEHVEDEKLTLAVRAPNFRERFSPRFYRRFNDLESVIVPPGITSVDGFVTIISLWERNWPEVSVDVYASVYNKYSRSSNFRLRHVGGRTWIVVDETVYWEGDGGPIVLPCTIDGKPCCFSDDPDPVLIPCDP